MGRHELTALFNFARHTGAGALIGLLLMTPEKTAANMSIAMHSITVEHIEIHSTRDFDSVAKNLESALPPLDPEILKALASGDLQTAEERIGDAALFIFLKRDHGALLRVAGQHRKAFQYEIGNPLTATKMTRHQLQAALYAPVRVTLLEDGAGGCIFAYDQPSSLFGQFGDDGVTKVALELDETLKTALLRSTQ
jgi:uncharacterized protein (DUF302 family)